LPNTEADVIRLFVFDLDGTLVDSLRDLADAANALLASCGVPPLDEQRIGGMVGEGVAMLVARAFEASGSPAPPDAVKRFLAIYETGLLNHTRPYDGVPKMLAALGARTPLALLTNKPLAATRHILIGLDLAKYFPDHAVVCGDGLFPRKPDPAGLRHLASRVEARQSDTLLVGDSVIDWRTARSAGTQLCVARYGFGFAGFPTHELTPHDRLIDTPLDLLRM
jgi:phosphoglycolate phosphatase